ncbi:uncharacterized protein [Blastocystis hominis]|uniref:Uncharacterized protein n=1 Tax=Blastocystis hominis TaxID=12968 RepID=D8M5W2_BLAHO|nr:uncharacterized protein [Blastocystis hominis]CBK23561.2 unnamed protein product [Blastocystis hominis]|eukprot:XP_012897609.1 uncharacterized protein [Blastocystis hominis]
MKGIKNHCGSSGSDGGMRKGSRRSDCLASRSSRCNACECSTSAPSPTSCTSSCVTTSRSTAHAACAPRPSQNRFTAGGSSNPCTTSSTAGNSSPGSSCRATRHPARQTSPRCSSVRGRTAVRRRTATAWASANPRGR